MTHVISHTSAGHQKGVDAIRNQHKVYDNRKGETVARRVARFFITFFGAAVGPGIIALVSSVLSVFGVFVFGQQLLPWAQLTIYVLSGVATAVLFFILAPGIIDTFVCLGRWLEARLTEMETLDIITCSMGLIIGLFMAFLLSSVVQSIPVAWVSVPLSIIIYVLLGYLGWSIAFKRRNDIAVWLKRGQRAERTERHERGEKPGRMSAGRPKILDTSVIIDGRIFDICQTGIVEGTLVIPNFVLQELRHIADSADSLKRNRGRRGLDVLNRIQKELDISVRIEERDYEDIVDVDAKLLRLAKDIHGVVVTNDYNLNKVADVTGVNVFNINELANAVKPVLLPGEEMHLLIVKDGKEANQGVSYLDDGTMIVVDNGKPFINEEVDVVVTSVLQTSAGRMIFARIKGADKSA